MATVALAASIGAAAVLAAPAPRAPDPAFDGSVPATPGIMAASAAATREEPTPVLRASEATATVESHVVVEAPGSRPGSSGRVVVTNNGTATASTGGNTGQNIVTGPATAVASDAVVIIK